MSPTIKKELSNRLLDRLFAYYITNSISSKESPESVVAHAKAFIKKLSKEDRQEFIHQTPDLEPGLFEIPKGSGVSAIELFDGLDNFCRVVYELLTKQTIEIEDEIEDIKPVQRKKIPTLKAFDFIGNNDLKISYKLSNYALNH